MHLSISSNWSLSNYSTLSSDCLMLDVPQTNLENLLFSTTVFNGVWFVAVSLYFSVLLTLKMRACPQCLRET